MKNGKHPSQEKIPALAKEQLDVELDDLEVCKRVVQNILLSRSIEEQKML